MPKKIISASIPEKFLRLFGSNNRSEIVTAALAKYFNDEKEKNNGYLQLIRENIQAIDETRKELAELKILAAGLKKRIDLNFNVSQYAAHAVDLFKENSGAKNIFAEKINEAVDKYQKLQEEEEKHA